MANIDQLIKAWDSAHWELSESFRDLPDDDVWVRVHPKLFSVGELAAHIAYGEAHAFFGGNFASPLLETPVQYYPKSIDTPLVLPMTGAEVFAELERIHLAAKESLVASPHEYEDPSPYREGWTWGYVVEYHAFHLAYHTGQIYAVRHVLGHDTVDN